MTDGVVVGVGVVFARRDEGLGVGVAVGVGVENVSSSSDINDSVSILDCDDLDDDPTDDFVEKDDDVDEPEAVVAVGVG